MIVFDIETGPQPEEKLRDLMPEFDPSEVKCGNLKDAAKIAEKIEAAKKAHGEKYIERAALSATTGQVLAIGVCNEIDTGLIDGDIDDDEEMLLINFWRYIGLRFDACNTIIGFNIFAFDLPFLVRRSWALDVDVPDNLIDRNRYWNPLFVDLLEVWRLGNRGEYISLDALAQSFGLKGKPEDGTTGADFARLWVEDRPRAILYLKNDLRMTYEVANCMQIV